jgi:hypothetical protein
LLKLTSGQDMAMPNKMEPINLWQSSIGCLRMRAVELRSLADLTVSETQDLGFRR